MARSHTDPSGLRFRDGLTGCSESPSVGMSATYRKAGSTYGCKSTCACFGTSGVSTRFSLCGHILSERERHGFPMSHHWEYIELAWYIAVGLGAFRVLSQFAIKMIAIFGRDKFSERAFQVLRISRAERAPNALRSEDDRASIDQGNADGR